LANRRDYFSPDHRHDLESGDRRTATVALIAVLGHLPSAQGQNDDVGQVALKDEKFLMSDKIAKNLM
jgi:hypothetical protein